MKKHKFRFARIPQFFTLIFVLFTLSFTFIPQEQHPSEQVDSLIKSLIAEKGPGFAVGVIKNGKFVHKKGYGYADLDKMAKIKTDTPFYLGSVSKQFTSMAIMILKDRGKLSFDDRLMKYFPEAPEEWGKITIKHLLTHTSGLTDMFKFKFDKEFVSNEDVYRKLAEVKKLDFEPGEKYSYSNSGYIMIAMVVEKVSGEHFYDFVRNHIFKPLKMKNSVVYNPTKPKIKYKARGYSSAGNGYRLYDYNLTTMGGGGLYSTVEDIYRWDQALYTEKIVSKNVIQEAFTGHVESGETSKYGYGWSISDYKGSKVVRHGGSLRGFKTYFLRIPDKKFSVILLSNGNFQNLADVAEKIRNIYLEE